MEKVSGVFHDKIAYIFPEPVDVSVANKTYTGKWQDISKQAWAKNKTEEQKDLFSLWINHGKKLFALIEDRCAEQPVFQKYFIWR